MCIEMCQFFPWLWSFFPHPLAEWQETQPWPQAATQHSHTSWVHRGPEVSEAS